MRVWLVRDIIPTIEDTNFFTCPLSPKYQNIACKQLCFRFVQWVNSGAYLPLLGLQIEEGQYAWLMMRQYQKNCFPAPGTPSFSSNNFGVIGMMECVQQGSGVILKENSTKKSKQNKRREEQLESNMQEASIVDAMTEQEFISLLDKLDG